MNYSLQGLLHIILSICLNLYLLMCINEVFTWIPNRRNQTFFLALTTDNQRHLPVRLMSTDSKHSYVKGGKQHWGKKINQLCIADWLSGIFYGFVYERLPWPRFKCNAVSKLQASNVTKLNCSHYNQQCCLCHNACSLIIMGAIYAARQIAYFYMHWKSTLLMLGN